MPSSSDLQEILDGIDDALIRVSRSLEGVYINPAAQDLIGRTPEQFEGSPLEVVLSARTYSVLAGPLRRALAAGSPVTDLAVEPVPGRRFECRLYPSESGVTVLLRPREESTADSETQDRPRLEDQVRFLAEASPILTSSLDYESTLQAVATLMVPEMGDWCSIDMLEDGVLEQLAVAHVDPAKVQFARELREKYPVDMDDRTGMPNVVRTGRAELYPEISEEMLVQSARDEEHLRVIRQIGFTSALVVPLEARGQILGAITLVWSESDRHYSEADLRFVEEIAHRAAIVVDNARLYRRAQEAREELAVLNEMLEQRVAERTDELSAANETLLEEIDERKRAQQALARANALLEYRNRELQDFAYVASHDLQEPLRKIQSFSGILLDEYAEQVGDGKNFLERIVDATDRMLGLIRDLLTFSRVATQGDPFRNVSLNTIVEEVLEDLEVRIQETGGTVEVGELCTIEADELQMRQLFQNLIGNALKFHRDGIAPLITVDCRIRGDYCEVEVRDNGIGFDEKYVDRIFAPFQRLHGRGTYPGTGIGLAICRRIVERHDGSIRAHSRPEEGSTFQVNLPLRHFHRSESDLGSEASAA